MHDFELQHPDITAAEATGYPEPYMHSRLHCERCGCGIYEDMPYYEIEDKPLCPDCVLMYLRYA